MDNNVEKRVDSTILEGILVRMTKAITVDNFVRNMTVQTSIILFNGCQSH